MVCGLRLDAGMPVLTSRTVVERERNIPVETLFFTRLRILTTCFLSRLWGPSSTIIRQTSQWSYRNIDVLNIQIKVSNVTDIRE